MPAPTSHQGEDTEATSDGLKGPQVRERLILAPLLPSTAPQQASLPLLAPSPGRDMPYHRALHSQRVGVAWI